MAQQKPEGASMDEILRLVELLSPEDQEQLVDDIKLQWLRRELAKAEASLERGEGIPGEVVLAELRQRAEDRLKKSQ